MAILTIDTIFDYFQVRPLRLKGGFCVYSKYSQVGARFFHSYVDRGL